MKTEARIITLDHSPATRWPAFGPEAEAAVIQVLRDGNVSTHPVIRELEDDYAAFTGRNLQPGDPIHIFRKPDAPDYSATTDPDLG